MTVTLWLSIALAGGLGATVRYLVDQGIQRLRASTTPLGIFVVNISASLFTGAVVGFAQQSTGQLVAESTRIILVVGFLGGYSTLSTVAIDTVLLLKRRQFWWATLNSVGMLVLSIIATLAGVMLAASATALQ
jgi:CrcB protein